MIRLTFRALAFALALSLSGNPAPARAAALNLFYVAVGNSHYRQSSAPGVRSFSDSSGGNKSARMVAAALHRIGARGGVLFRSEEGRFVTRAQVLRALRETIAQAKKHPKPFIVYYFVGHGISEGVAWNHFSIPGEFVGTPEKMRVETLAQTTLHTADVFDLLKASGVPFLMMLDNCQEGETAQLTTRVFSEALRQNIGDAFQVLRYMNEFREPNPVLFSTAPGTVTRTVKDPSNPASPLSVGPLGRRFALVVTRTLQEQKAVTLGEFVTRMKSPGFDLTKPAVCLAELSNPNTVLIEARPKASALAGQRVQIGAFTSSKK